MGIYSRLIFPRLCNCVLDQPWVNEQRRIALSAARGEALEIGFGTGLNVPQYPAEVRKIVAVDPNPGMLRLARQRIDQSGIEVEQRIGTSEALPLGDGAVECVVSTFTLCSVASVERAVAEIYRVLRPGGQFLFLEHGLSREASVQRWQRRLNWLQRMFGDGCRLDRDMAALVASEPFANLKVKEYYLEKTPRTHGYLYRGVAKK